MYETIAYFYCQCGLLHFADDKDYLPHLAQRKLTGVLVWEEIGEAEWEQIVLEDNERRRVKGRVRREPEPAALPIQGKLF